MGSGSRRMSSSAPSGRMTISPPARRPSSPASVYRRLDLHARSTAGSSRNHGSRSDSEITRAPGPVVLRAVIVAALAAAGLAAAAPQTAGRPGRQSVRGRAIVGYERGDPAGPVTLVVGVIHGTEPAGLSVVSRLRRMRLPKSVHLWLVPTVNPDRLAAGTRQNVHGVDLNRNWPTAWVPNGRPWDGYYSGPRPLSEPENRAMLAFILRVRPALTIWYHQPLDEVYGSDPHIAVFKRYARLSGLRTDAFRRRGRPCAGSGRGSRTVRISSSSFPRAISAATARRNAAAVLALAPR